MRNDDTAWQLAGLEAMRDMFAVTPQQRKEMIQFLFDEGYWDASKLTWEAAEARWNDCKNPGKAAFWKITELWALMRRFGRHQLLLAMNNDLGYEVRKRPTEERLQDLLEQMTEQMERSERELAACREQLAAVTAARAAAPQARPGGTVARFRMDPTDDENIGTGRF